MRLSLKFALMIGIGATVIVLVMSVLAAKRDVKIVEDDMLRDASLIATVVASAIENSANNENLTHLLASLDKDFAGITISLEAVGTSVPQAALTNSVGTDEIVATAQIPGKLQRVVVREDLSPRDELLERSLRTASITVISVMLLAIGAGLQIGQWLVGRPVQKLVAMTRAVANADYSLRLETNNSDELGDLASELNLMSVHLKEIRDQSRADTEARLETQLQLLHADRLRMVGQLAAGLAHELGTPLSVIAGRASLLERTLEKLGAEPTNAKIIHDQTNQIVKIVKQLMDFARPVLHDREQVDLHALCSETINLLKPLAGERNLHLKGEPGSLVWGDGEQLRHVIANIVMNAIQATEATGEVLVTIKSQSGGVQMTIEDDGEGLEPDIIERIFEPFFTTKQVGEGTGLGLSIVHGIIEEHRGTISARTSALGGARFAMMIPFGEER